MAAQSDPNELSSLTGFIPIEPNGKKALIKWEEYQHRSPTPEETASWRKQFPGCNWALVTGEVSRLAVLDVDPRHGGLESLKGRVLPLTRTVRTPSGGTHYYFKHPGGPFPSIPGLLPGVDLKAEGGYVNVPPSRINGSAYEVVVDEPIAPSPAWLPELVAHRKTGTQPERISDRIPVGKRNITLTSLAGTMRRRGMSEAAILAALMEENARCDPPLPEREVAQIARSIARYLTTAEGLPPTPEDVITSNTVSWPDAPAPEAFYGLAGEIVSAIAPHSEADPTAILVQLLTVFGNVVGRGSYFTAEADRHGLNEFVVLVGDTSKGRKGSAWGHVRRLVRNAATEWVDQRLQSGLSSGEGLIWSVRDPIERRDPVKEKGRVVDYETVVADPGVEDKRLLVLEAEFSRTLRVMGRDGNTLSAVIRQAWDIGDLRVLTKTSPAVATGAHISIVGHITKSELLRYLNDTEAGNGFANRFLFVCVKRSKVLPEGGNIEEVDFGPLTQRLHQAIEFARRGVEIKRDDEARAIWYKVYPSLSEGKPGLQGAITSRAEAHVMRLACIYSTLACSPVIRKPHLLAALALWDYVEDSVRYIFGELLGDPMADEIDRALHARPAGMTRAEIRGFLGHHVRGDEIDRALAFLETLGRAHRQYDATSGRSAERWWASVPSVPSVPFIPPQRGSN